MILPTYLRNSSPWLSDFSRFFDQAFRQPGTPQQPFRVLQDDDGWTLELDLPGVPKEALEIEVADRTLRIGDTREGHFTNHSLPLGTNVDVESVNAELKDGVLTVRLPRRATNRKTIEIL